MIDQLQDMNMDAFELIIIHIDLLIALLCC